MDVLAATGTVGMRGRRAGWTLAFVLLLGLFGLPAGSSRAHAESIEGPEAIKAAYIYKFTNYVQWPGNAFVRPDSPIVIGVMGDDELAGLVGRIVSGKVVNGRGFEIRPLRPGASITGVHVLYVGEIGRSDLLSVLGQAQGQPVLVVSDSRRAYALGSMINFVVVDSRLRFEVALQPAARNGLKLSALMLTAAYDVAREGP
jgi:hypothetical protein